MARNHSAGRILLTVSAAYAGVGAFIFDWNKTHIYNPAWPPHAKFHNAQTMSLGAGLGVLALAALWSPHASWTRGRLNVATAAASLYWATQLTAMAYPGTSLVDPPSKDNHAQMYVALTALAVNAIAYASESLALSHQK